MTLPDLKAKLEIYNVAAFLRIIREGETNQKDDAYTLINGGAHLVSFVDHPYAGQSAPPGRAAGAYQFIPHTWQALVKQYGFADFSPGNQDLGAVALVAGRKALDDVIAGNLDAAIAKCRQEWTSLPGAAENTRLTLARCKEVFTQYGGTLQETLSAKPVFDTAPKVVSENKPMLPFLLPILAQLIPQVAKILIPDGGGEVAQRNQALANTVVDAVVQATSAATGKDHTPASAIEALSADKDLLEKVRAAVVTHPEVVGLLEVGGGIQAAREVANNPAGVPFWKQGAFYVSASFVLLFAFAVVAAFVLHSDDDMARSQERTYNLVMLVAGFWLGSSWGSQKKDEFKSPT